MKQFPPAMQLQEYVPFVYALTQFIPFSFIYLLSGIPFNHSIFQKQIPFRHLELVPWTVPMVTHFFQTNSHWQISSYQPFLPVIPIILLPNRLFLPCGGFSLAGTMQSH